MRSNSLSLATPLPRFSPTPGLPTAPRRAATPAVARTPGEDRFEEMAQPRSGAATAPRMPVGVSDKRHGHSGYFAYELRDDGKIYAKWDPILAKQPFYLTAIEPADEKALNQKLARIVGPYAFQYQAAYKRILVTLRTDIPAKGYVSKGGRLVPRTTEPEWHLFDGQGGPELSPRARLVEMQVASDVIMARDSKGTVHLYKPTVTDGPASWDHHIGFPWNDELHLPDGTDWSLGVSVGIDHKKATLEFMNPATDIVSYGETEAGMKVAAGITISWLARDPDGHSFYMGDTGLNADKQRRFLTPHHGQFYAAAAPAGAGSTYLLYGFEPDGTPALYTRRYDYEIFGGCPDIPFTYDPQPFDQAKVYDLAERPRDVPRAPWQRVDFPVLLGRAQLTDAISVHTTGEGNAAREFHIAGTSPSGVVGYYYKAIGDAAWRFQATPGAPLHGRIIDLTQKGPTTSQPITMDYPQASWSGFQDASVRAITLLDFHPYQTPDEPSRLRFTLASGKTVEVLLRTCDAYSLLAHEPDDDRAMNQGIGEDKALMGTLDIPPALLDAAARPGCDPEVAHFVNDVLRPYNHVVNLFSVAADRDQVIVDTGGELRPNADTRVQLGALRMTFSRDASGETAYDRAAAAPELVPKPGMSRQRLSQIIHDNERVARMIEKDLSWRRERHREERNTHVLVKWVLIFLLWLAHVFGVDRRYRNLIPARDAIPRVEDAQLLAARDILQRTPAAYSRALGVLQHNRALAARLIRS